MRISDWSSDVCSSDLGLLERNRENLTGATPVLRRTLQEAVDNLDDLASVITGLDEFNRGWACAADGNYLNFVFPLTPELATVDITPGICDNVEAGSRGRTRSEERRVGKECVRPCSTRRSPTPYKTHQHTTPTHP